MGRRRSAVWLLVGLLALLAAPLAYAGEEAPPTAPPAAGAPTTAPEETPPAAAPQPETPAPGTGEPGTSAPGAEQPETSAPSTEQPGTPAPGTGQPEAPAPTTGQPEVTPAPELQVPPTVAPVIVSIEVVGNQVIATKDIVAVVGSEVGQAYSEQQAMRDEEAITALGWFSRVTVEREVTEAGIRLVFRVAENPVVTAIQFEGVTVFTPEQLRAVMKTKPSTVYNRTVVRQDLETIQGLYASRGYTLAMVLNPGMSTEGVLTIPVLEGQIEAVRIRGNTKTKEYVVRRMIRTKPGDIYNQARIQADLGRLVASDLFQSVQVVQEVGTAPGKVVVIFDVVEKRRTGQATFGFGYSSVQGAVGFVDLTKTNLRGTAQSVTVRAEFGGRSSYEFYYVNPWVANQTRANLGLYNRLIVREAQVETETGSQSVLYDERREGGSLTFGRALNDRTTAYLGFRSDSISVSGLSEEEKALLVGFPLQEKNVNSVTLGIVSDQRDFPRNPRRGTYHQFAAEFAGVLGGSAFDKFVLDERRYFPIRAKDTIALRLLAGTETDAPPYLEEFLIGGADTLRGYRNDQFVGTHMAILNTEYRHPLTQNLSGVLFVDVGDAWGGPIVTQTPIEGDTTFTPHVGYGFGIRVAAPIALRLDIGFGQFGTETHFGLGHVF
jgi:outer membrane protein insertion porin family